MIRNFDSILVLGAGELGTFVLENLAKHPAKGKTSITVLLRSSTINTKDENKKIHVSKIQELGVKLLAGDIERESADELCDKFAPFDAVVVCTGMYSPPGTQTKIAKAVLQAKIKLFLPWQYGLDYDAIGKDSAQDLFTEQLGVRDLLRAQKTTTWVIVSTGLFMSFLFEDLFGIVSADRKTVRGLGSWENMISITEAEDIGRMVAEVVLAEHDINDEVVYVAGETISYGDIAKAVEMDGCGSINKEIWTVEKLKKDLEQDPSNYLTKYRIIFAEGNGTAWDATKTLNHKRNIPLLDIQGWLMKHKI